MSRVDYPSPKSDAATPPFITRRDPAEACLLFVDDSNIWIEAQKLAALGTGRRFGLADSDRDPRLRIDVGKLIGEVLNGRTQGPSFLYGSRLVPSDSVWSVFQKCQFETKIYDRSNGKEKEVDTAMSVDMSCAATKISLMAEFYPETTGQKARTTFVVVTGDRDMIPPIKKVLESGIRVELWAWSSGLSKDYYRLQFDNDSLLSVNHLDWLFDRISFTNFRSTRQTNMDPARTIVLCDSTSLDRDSDDDEDDIESWLCTKLMTLGRLFYISQSDTEPELFIEFPMASNMDAVVLDVQKILGARFNCLSWPEYRSRFTAVLPSMKTGNVYSPLSSGEELYSATGSLAGEIIQNATLDVFETIDAESGDDTADSNEGGESGEGANLQDLDRNDSTGGWTMVNRSDARSLRRRKHATQCVDGIHCRRYGGCDYQHTDAERKLFLRYADTPITLLRWKTKKCDKSIPHPARDCPYAHTHVEAWCLVCRRNGHYTESCRYRCL